jgi:hypothetical protein
MSTAFHQERTHVAERFKQRIGERFTAEAKSALRKSVQDKTAKLLFKEQVKYEGHEGTITRYNFWAMYEGEPINFTIDSLGHFVTIFRPIKRNY